MVFECCPGVKKLKFFHVFMLKPCIWCFLESSTEKKWKIRRALFEHQGGPALVVITVDWLPSAAMWWWVIPPEPAAAAFSKIWQEGERKHQHKSRKKVKTDSESSHTELCPKLKRTFFSDSNNDKWHIKKDGGHSEGQTHLEYWLWLVMKTICKITSSQPGDPNPHKWL